jgi:hypothetical protein
MMTPRGIARNHITRNTAVLDPQGSGARHNWSAFPRRAVVTIAPVPFTISHAAAVLPLGRTRLPMAALMIGSMAPDFAYFLPTELGLPTGAGLLSHSVSGLFSFCWPVALCVWLLFVYLLEAPTRALLSDGWQAAFPRSDRALTPRNLALASIAVIIGATTHLLWDSFTHANTPMVDQIPLLESNSVQLFGKHFPLYRFLQHLSTVVGLIALAGWAARRRKSVAATGEAASRAPAASHAERIVALLGLLTLSGTLAVFGYVTQAALPFGRRLFHFAIGGMTGWALAWIVIAIILQLRWRQRQG